jgi:hypothetical protein
VSALASTADINLGGAYVCFVPKPDVLARLFLDRKWRATADEDGQYCFAVAL